jgi:hypothetical protein
MACARRAARRRAIQGATAQAYSVENSIAHVALLEPPGAVNCMFAMRRSTQATTPLSAIVVAESFATAETEPSASIVKRVETFP